MTLDRVSIQEQIRDGQRVRSFRVDAWRQGAWQSIAEGTTIGYKRLLRFKPVSTSRVRLVILDSRAIPAISEFGLFKAPP
jgi:alpha-L-fucosidase